MKKIVLFFILAGLFFSELRAQSTRYIVRLKNKGATSFTLNNASAYLSQRAISRRTRYNIAIDSSDLPIPSSYISQLQNIPNVTVLNTSRWLNAVTIRTTDANALNTINALPFVQNIKNIAARTTSINKKNTAPTLPVSATARVTGIETDYFEYGTTSFNEIHLNNGEFLHNIGLRGQGIQNAILDGGFYNYNNLRSLDSININGQVLGTWDFVNHEASVTEDIVHGMQCLSTIAANIPGQFVGKAPKASFYLFRTEDDSQEYPIEEFNWVCGAERADSSGSDIISSSVGYYDFDDAAYNYSYADMNGHTTIASMGADLAAKKGLLVFNSAGNSGLNAYKYISTPADADSILAVGSVNLAGVPAASSSYGPSADGRVKPDIAGPGVSVLVQAANNTIGTNSGTSFACPNMAGLGTCLWQGFPEYNNMKIVQAIRQAGSIATAPNDRVGYGIPNMKIAFSNLLKEFATSSGSVNSCKVVLNWTSKDIAAMKYEVERKLPGETSYTKITTISPQAGILLANHSYSYENTLSNATAGTISYRIRQIIDTTAASFTDVYIDTTNITLSTACTTTAINDPTSPVSKLFIAPNPASDNTFLIIESATGIPTITVAIYDMKGRLITKLQRSIGSGRSVIDLAAYRLSNGKYIIKVYNKQKEIGTTELLKL